MIWAVTFNPSRDMTFYVEGSWHPATICTARSVYARAGGKGNNVARVIHELGYPVTAVGVYGGPTGEVVQKALESSGIPVLAEVALGDTRTCLTIVDGDGRVTEIREPGPSVDAATVERLLDQLLSVVGPGDWVTLSGSLPPGLGIEIWPRWIGALRARCRGVLVDTSGANLLAAAEAKPLVLLPNRAEWEEAQLADIRPLLITDGELGALWYPPEGPPWRIRSPKVPVKNTVGAGDALLGGLVTGLGQGCGWDGALRLAVAVAASSVTSPAVADIDRHLIETLLPQVTMELETSATSR